MGKQGEHNKTKQGKTGISNRKQRKTQKNREKHRKAGENVGTHETGGHAESPASGSVDPLSVEFGV